MATFTFIAYNDEGTGVTGAKKSASINDMARSLEQKGYSNINIFPSETNFKTNLYSLVSPKELSVFCRQMSVLFFSHITLMEGIELLASQSGNNQLKLALSEIYKRMEEGFRFSQAIGMYTHIFGNYLLNMITIGESSGTLDSVFARMSDYFDKESKIRKKIKSAVTYPVVLSILMSAIILLLILKILPMFQSTLATMGGSVPASSKIIFAIASFISRYFIFIVIVIAAVFFGLTAYIRTEKGRYWFDKMKVSIALSKYINARVITTRFARSLAILLKGGVQLLNAMEEIITLIDNKFLEIQFRKAFLLIKNGENLTEVLGKIEIFPPLFIRMIKIGHTTGHLDEMLEKSANVFDEEVDEALERVSVMVEPALIIILSIVVGIILLSVMLPMIGIMNAIG